MNKPKRALSIKQPYAEMILRGKKQVEYRTGPTRIRERVYIYASKNKMEDDSGDMDAHPENYPVGVLVGTVEITDCTEGQECYEWHLSKPERLLKPLTPENRPQPRWFYPFKKVEDFSIAQFRRAIQLLPSDEPENNPEVWYTTQKEHWLCWLCQYDGPGAYDRIPDQGRDARYAYNHIVNHQMLLWIIDAAGVSTNLVKAARRASEKVDLMQQKSASIRKLVPWSVLADALWGSAKQK